MHYSHESKALQKPPRVSRNRTRDPSPNGTVTAAEEKGGGAHRRRGCSGEGSGEVGPRAQTGELVGGEESGLTRAR
jgi:hypothetical protein